MRAGPSRTLFGAATAISIVLLNTATAVAQLVQSDVDAEPGTSETVSLVTSSTEVRRSVIALLALAFITGVLGIVYWYKTGQLARDRHVRRHGGRHQAGQPYPAQAAVAQSAAILQPAYAGEAPSVAEWPTETTTVNGAPPYVGAQGWDSQQPYPDASHWVDDPSQPAAGRGSRRRDLFG